MATSSNMSTTGLLFRRAGEMGLEPEWLVRNGLFAVTINGKEQFINFERSPFNSHIGISLSGNKYLTRLILKRNGLPNIPFCKPRNIQKAEEFLAIHGKIIAKPLRGSGSRDINIVTNKAQLSSLEITKYILEKYIAGIELRYLVLEGKVIAVHQSIYGQSVEASRTLERVSFEEIQWDAERVEMSLAVAKLLGLKFVAVDYLITPQGESYILEVGSAPGFKWFHAPSSGPSIDIAKLFLEAYITNSGSPVVEGVTT